MSLAYRTPTTDRSASPSGAATGDWSSIAELATILAGPMPTLPSGTVAAVASELRRMATTAACDTWRHHGWAALVAWINRRAPACDPTVPAIHAVRQAPLVRRDPAAARRVTAYVLHAARNAPGDRSTDHEVRLEVDPRDRPAQVRSVSDSLAAEAAHLFRSCGLTPGAASWETISAGIDIAADWWAGFASDSGLAGDVLVSATRDSVAMNSGVRLRHHLQGPAGRPLVALLLGGDQWGRRARSASGREASLVIWALDVRRARRAGEDDPCPPPAVVRAWATTINLIEAAVASNDEGGAALGPTVAA